MRTSAETAVYLDSSALVKLVVDEAESTALRAAVASAPTRVSCALARVEVVRAVRANGPNAVSGARKVLEAVDVIELDTELLDLAAELDAPLRSLDAIHVAAALELGDGLGALVTYDARVATAAGALGLPVICPT